MVPFALMCDAMMSSDYIVTTPQYASRGQESVDAAAEYLLNGLYYIKVIATAMLSCNIGIVTWFLCWMVP